MILDENFAICRKCAAIKSMNKFTKKKDDNLYKHKCDFSNLLKYKRV